MSVSVVKNENENISLTRSAAGVGAGYATFVGGKKALRKTIGKSYSNYFFDNVGKIQPAENDTFWRAAHQAFQTSPLTNKDVKIVNLTPSNFETFRDDTLAKIVKPINKKGWVGKIQKKLLDRKIKKFKKSLYAISLGKNACYIPATKTVALNKNKMSFSTFHELGHSINHASKGFAGKLHKNRKYFALLAPVILLTSLLTKKKSKDEKPKNTAEKITTFTKENCGKLMFACMIPTLAEEGLASVNANKLAKKVLSPELLKKMNSLNIKAWGTYLLGATITGACGALAVWVKDKITQPKIANN